MKSRKHIKWMLALLFVVTMGILYFLDRKGDSGARLLQAPLEGEVQDTAVNSAKTDEKKPEGSGQTDAGADIPPLPDSSGEISAGQDGGTGGQICVHVCGAVRTEGVYLLPAGSRVADAVAAAGGMTDEAAGSAVNQAAAAVDGSQVYIPTREEQEQSPAGNAGIASAGPGEEDALLDLNLATKEQLMTLPGIGEAKADSILDYREKQGGFRKKEEIMNIAGIKEGVYSKFCDLIYVK